MARCCRCRCPVVVAASFASSSSSLAQHLQPGLYLARGRRGELDVVGAPGGQGQRGAHHERGLVSGGFAGRRGKDCWGRGRGRRRRQTDAATDAALQTPAGDSSGIARAPPPPRALEEPRRLFRCLEAHACGAQGSREGVPRRLDGVIAGRRGRWRGRRRQSRRRRPRRGEFKPVCRGRAKLAPARDGGSGERRSVHS